MTKRITALLIAVIIPAALIFSGCSKRLSAKEYYDQLYANFKEYTAAAGEIATVQDGIKNGAATDSLRAQATEGCKKAMTALEKFDKMNPPKMFSDKHKKLVEAVDLEKKFKTASEKLLIATNSADEAAATSELSAVFSSVPESQQFPALFVSLLPEAKSEAEK